jgi:hypothetical protein
MLNYIHSDVKDRQLEPGDVDIAGSGDILQTRLQVDF